VDHPRDQLLAGPALALDEDGGARGGDLAELLDHHLHAGAAPDDVLDLPGQGGVEGEDRGATGLALQVEGAAGDELDLLAAEGLLQEVEGAELHGLDGGGHVAVPGDDRDRRFAGERLELGQQGDPVTVR
jgi:hypothetical protein